MSARKLFLLSLLATERVDGKALPLEDVPSTVMRPSSLLETDSAVLSKLVEQLDALVERKDLLLNNTRKHLASERERAVEAAEEEQSDHAVSLDEARWAGVHQSAVEEQNTQTDGLDISSGGNHLDDKG